MKLLQESQLDEAVNVLYKAFYEDKFFNHIFENEEDKTRYMKFIIKAWILHCHKYGQIHHEEADDRIIGVMGFLNPGEDYWTEEMMTNSGFKGEDEKVPQEFRLRRHEVTEAFSDVDGKIPENSIYFFFVGVLPEYQGKGYGKKLIEKVLDNAKNQNAAVYLDTEEETNKDLYERFGFEVINDGKGTSPIDIWIMVKF